MMLELFTQNNSARKSVGQDYTLFYEKHPTKLFPTEVCIYLGTKHVKYTYIWISPQGTIFALVTWLSRLPRVATEMIVVNLEKKCVLNHK